MEHPTWVEIAMFVVTLVATIVAAASALVSFLSFRWARSEAMMASAESEMARRTAINTAQRRIDEVRKEIIGIVRGRPKSKLSADEKRLVTLAEHGLNSALEEWCNVFETICGQYLDGKCDKKRFKKSHLSEIRTLVESDCDSIKAVLKPGDTSSYRAIMAVYREWCHLE